MAMVTAVETRPGTDPDRASFTTALEAAREELTMARGLCPRGPADLRGVIGRAVLSTLLPARRLRYSARKIKAPTSRYQARDDPRPHAPTVITAIDIAIPTPALDPKPRRAHDSPRTPAAPAAHPARADHRHHHQPAAPGLEWPRTGRPPAGQAAHHAHPAA